MYSTNDNYFTLYCNNNNYFPMYSKNDHYFTMYNNNENYFTMKMTRLFTHCLWLPHLKLHHRHKPRQNLEHEK